MKLRFFGIENPVEFRQNYVSVLEIGNKTLLRNVVFNLYKLYNDLQADMSIVLEDDHKIETLSKFELATDVLGLDLSASQVKLNKYILAELEKNQEEYKVIFDDMTEINSKFFSFLDDIPFDLCYNEIEVLDLIKDFNFKLDNNCKNGFLTNVLNYLQAVKLLKIADLIIFVDLKKYFSETDLKQIYDLILILDLRVLLIESYISPEMLPNEWKLSVDDDLYESIPLEL